MLDALSIYTRCFSKVFMLRLLIKKKAGRITSCLLL